MSITCDYRTYAWNKRGSSIIGVRPHTFCSFALFGEQKRASACTAQVNINSITLRHFADPSSQEDTCHHVSSSSRSNQKPTIQSAIPLGAAAAELPSTRVGSIKATICIHSTLYISRIDAPLLHPASNAVCRLHGAYLR